jgi:DNA-binding NarL/FixJ family response regulator
VLSCCGSFSSLTIRQRLLGGSRDCSRHTGARSARGACERPTPLFPPIPDFSALIVDLHLFVGSELEVLRNFRSGYPNHPALVLTEYSEPAAINAAYDLNADYVMKPFNGARIHNSFGRKSCLDIPAQ